MRKPSLNRAELMLLGLMVHRSSGPYPFDPDEACILGRSLGVPDERADAVRAIFNEKVEEGETLAIETWHRGRMVDVLAVGRQALRLDALGLLDALRFGDLPAAVANNP